MDSPHLILWQFGLVQGVPCPIMSKGRGLTSIAYVLFSDASLQFIDMREKTDKDRSVSSVFACRQLASLPLKSDVEVDENKKFIFLFCSLLVAPCPDDSTRKMSSFLCAPRLGWQGVAGMVLAVRRLGSGLGIDRKSLAHFTAGVEYLL